MAAPGFPSTTLLFFYHFRGTGESLSFLMSLSGPGSHRSIGGPVETKFSQDHTIRRWSLSRAWGHGIQRAPPARLLPSAGAMGRQMGERRGAREVKMTAMGSLISWCCSRGFLLITGSTFSWAGLLCTWGWIERKQGHGAEDGVTFLEFLFYVTVKVTQLITEQRLKRAACWWVIMLGPEPCATISLPFLYHPQHPPTRPRTCAYTWEEPKTIPEIFW